MRLESFDVPIAEWNIFNLMINLLRDLRGMIRNQDQGVWDRDSFSTRDSRADRWLLGFYGGSARETARLAKAMACRVHAPARNGVKPGLNPTASPAPAIQMAYCRIGFFYYGSEK